ncbi:MAG TPA: sulfotransferase domain-containing protein [Streptosporangiaceae bacterium]|nr:sulfotransferase domain-containing protein [Streptosporangiaceae bacterium]
MSIDYAVQAGTSPGIVVPIPPPAARGNEEIGPPDFVGVGTMRSGTTWWYSLLAAHPTVAEPEQRYKEVHFFDHYQRVVPIDPVSYHRYFPRPPSMMCGEWTPRYMYDYWTPPMLRRAAPRAKILVQLRDPVTRFLSGLSHHQSHGYQVTQALLHQQYERSLYAVQIQTLLAYYPSEQVLVLQYERCLADPIGQIHRTLEFIGVDPADWRGESMIPARVSQTRPAPPELDPATYEALATALCADLPGLFALLPDLDPELWPTTVTPPRLS